LQPIAFEETDMTSALATSSTRRQPLSRKHGDQWRLLIAVALFLAVLVADAVVIARGAATISNLAALYSSTT
jgi:hypothetical protein